MYQRVLIESPYSGSTPEETAAHATYLQRCIRHACLLGESPIASHFMLTQALDDQDSHERHLGIGLGFVWRAATDATVVYLDRGVSSGMLLGLRAAKTIGHTIVLRAFSIVDLPTRCSVLSEFWESYDVEKAEELAPSALRDLVPFRISPETAVSRVRDAQRRHGRRVYQVNFNSLLAM